MESPKIVLTGGGTAGHVSLNQAIIPPLSEKGYDVHYIGSKDGIEKKLIQDSFPGVPYHEIQSGKLRRYFSMKNFTDPFKVGAGVLQAYRTIRKLKPELIFSKGGFVSVPVALAGRMAGVPVLIHESDVTPGLANRLAMPFADHVFTVFPETVPHVKKAEATCSGPIIRPELFEGSKKEGLRLAGLSGSRPVLLVMGGSQGSAVLNDAVRSNLPELLQTHEVIHLCGKGHLDRDLEGLGGYAQFEYVTDGLKDLLKAADGVVSRAGSNSIFEFLALQIPMLLIPLSAEKSRGDQILNARLFLKAGFAEVLEEEKVSKESFREAVRSMTENTQRMILAMEQAEQPKTPEEMASLILQFASNA
ncbi:undecaprenyldiphospho-muramoylpentapeptide beta-N-acetylglucosaminyltransferase [Bhargavaea cecembensis]|uniref:undecaprenyldiphospho-muramoylpentapeptide beta-N-acetylglucosaminyltransferase n=1 Tax=Bhargavaea cecembensis TaxID=394098 RepID=UPI00058C1EDB|nr:undecaprenyldiphospho-muramoylpentapeptide beta-N-acetylglucosaminyltransferase [Bhargavaea cecembensis]